MTQVKCLKCKQLRDKSSFGKSGFCSVCEGEEESEKLKIAMTRRKAHNEKKKAAAIKKKKQETYRKNHGPKTRKVRAVKKPGPVRKEATSALSQQSENAQQELAKRTLARRHLLPFVKMFVPRYKAGWVHKDICERLEKFYEDVKNELSPRLMLFMPPRHGKSELVTVNFPAWGFGHDPALEIISTSYSLGLSSVFSRKVRDRIKLDPKYRTLFPDTVLSKSQENIEHWGTSRGGSYISAGIGGPISGKGAHIAIIDDPVKNREEADSELIQERNWAWYRSTFRSRLAPGAGILIVQTRWSYEDISGKLISQMEKAEGEDHESWEIVEYPALAEYDEYINLETKEILRNPREVTDSMRLLRLRHEALHPERYNEKALRILRNTMGTREWSALYQQTPLPDSGDFFKREWFKPLTKDKATLDAMRNIMACDLALGTQKHNHNSAFAICAIDYNGTIFIREIIFGKWTTHEIVELILDKQVQYDLSLVGIERGTTKLAIDDQMRLRMRERGLSPTFDEELAPVTDKRVRARPIQGLMQAGMVYWPENNPWWETPAQSQLLKFDAANEDDIVDALAWIGRMYQHAGRPRNPTRKKKQKSWRDQLKVVRRGVRTAMSA